MTDPSKETSEGLTEGKFLAENDPFTLFSKWFSEAGKAEVSNPDAMALATVDQEGLPNVRMVLLKGFGSEGLVFYTNLQSAKGGELAVNAKAAIVLYWKSLNRQIRARGPVVPVSKEEADAYFATRPRGAQLGAWASKQSRPLEGRFALEAEIAKTTARYAIGAVPRPEHWSGFRIVPLEIEFWAEGKFRLHKRLLFKRTDSASHWSKTELYP
jgi:pyridoxamine 5'-phosphate oxidase